MALRLEENGYLSVGFCQQFDGKKHRFKVHRLVLFAFVGACPVGHQAAHNNGIATDNRLINLRWDTAKANHADKSKHATLPQGSKCYQAKLTEEIVSEIRQANRPDSYFAKKYGTGVHAISGARRGETWKHVSTPPQSTGERRTRYLQRGGQRQ